MQKKYGISKKDLIRDYLNINKNKTRKKWNYENKIYTIT